MSISFEIELEGLPESLTLLHGVSQRAVSLEPAFDRVIDVWEEIERHVFSDGVLVDTGRLMESLTGPGDGAIRTVHETEIIFGTDIDYARPAGHRTGHKVLAAPPDTADEIVMTYIMGEAL